MGAAFASLAMLSGDVAAGCTKEGKTCDRSGDCCEGGRCRCTNGRAACGGRCRDLDRDDNHCGACNNACAAGAACSGGVCFGEGGCAAGVSTCVDDGSFPCGGNLDCQCVVTRDGATRCADITTNNGFCGACDSDDDCAVLGAGAFCVLADGPESSCCSGLGSAEIDNVCMLPCPIGVLPPRAARRAAAPAADGRR
jgi:hypothetical protein